MERYCIHPTIHPSIFHTIYSTQGCEGANPREQEAGHPGQGAKTLLGTITHTFTSYISLQHMFLYWRRKLEYQGETPEARGEHENFT